MSPTVVEVAVADMQEECIREDYGYRVLVKSDCEVCRRRAEGAGWNGCKSQLHVGELTDSS